MKKGIASTVAILTVAISGNWVKAQLPPDGIVVGHNGTADSSPPGTGQVNVEFIYGLIVGPLDVRYQDAETFIVEFEYPEPDPFFGPEPFVWARSWVRNRLGFPITGMEILLEGADFAGWDTLNRLPARADNPVVATGNQLPDGAGLAFDQIGVKSYLPPEVITVSSSAVNRFNDDGDGFRDSLLTIDFDDPLDSDMVLYFNIIPSPGAAGATGFTMHMTAIPEPASVLLLGVGTWLTVRRRL